MATHRSGPLPESSEYRGYEDVLEGSAERILAMAEISAKAAADATHANAEATRANAEATRAAAGSVREDANTVKRGQYLYAGLTVLCLVLGTVLVVAGHAGLAAVPYVGSILTGIGIVVRPVNTDRWRTDFREIDES